MKRVLFVLIIFSSSIYSQLNVKVAANNLLRWGDGKELGISNNVNKKYFEELADVRLFVNDFTFGLRFEYDDPIEFGKGTKGISRRFVEFKKDGFNVRAGHFYELFDKGLTLNSFENRGLGFNTQVDGIRLNYKTEFKKMKFNATILGGDLVYNNFLDTSVTETYSIRGANFSFTPIKYIKLGGSALFSKGKIPAGNLVTNITSEIYEANLGLSYKWVDAFVSYANKVTLSESNILFPVSLAPRGDGAYGYISVATGGIGVTLDYKNYRFNLTAPDSRGASSPFKPLPFQVPPSCNKEYSSTLLTRNPHVVDFGDEVGFQIDAFYSPNDKLTINANASLTSRHYDYSDVDSSAGYRFQRIERSSNFIPSMRDAFSPYWEVYVEAEYYATKKLKVKLGVGRQTSVIYNIYNPASSETIRALTVPVEVKYDFMKKWSVKFLTEFQRSFNNIRAEQLNWVSQFTSISVSKSPNLILTGSFEFTDDKEDPSGKKFWGSGEVTYKFSSSNQLTFGYGSDRGGLKCTSGICRYVKPFNGFKLTVINNFN